MPEKMSEILLDFAEQLLADEYTEDSISEMEKALIGAVMIWNYAVVMYTKGAKRVKLLVRIRLSLMQRLYLGQIGKKGFFSMMLKRKQRLYPNNRRIIAGVDVHWDHEIDGPHW